MKGNQKTSRPVGLAGAILLCGLFGAAFGTLPSRAAADCENEWVISGSYTMDQDETYDCVHILSTGRLYTNQYKLTVTGVGGLTIDAGGRLFVNNSSGAVVLSGGGTSTVDGRIYLQVNGSELEIDEASHTLEGSGQIIGESDSAKINIAPGTTLTSEITIEGALEIRSGTGITANALGRVTFVNNGLVHANRVGTLEMYDGAIDDDGSEVQWKASGTGAILRFSVSATGLEGDFWAESGGKLQFAADVTTTGDLYMYCLSYIDIVGGAQFDYNSYSGDCATDPPDPITADFLCACP